MRDDVKKHGIVVCGALMVALSSGGVDGQGLRGVDFGDGLVEIVEDVYVFEGALHLPGESEPVRTNSLVVFDDEGIVVVDGQDTIAEGELLLNAIRRRSDVPIRYLVTASPHGDHVHAHRLFSEAVIVGQSGTVEAIEAQRSEEFEPVPPEITYEKHLRIRVGAKTVDLFYFGPAHTAADTITYLPEQGVVFLSEVYFNRVFPSVYEGFAESHLKVLDEAAALNADWFIPGHGVVSGLGAAELREGMANYRHQIASIIDMVRKHVTAGDSLEATLAAADEELKEFADVPFYGFLKERSIRGTYRALSEKGSPSR